jgi:lysophospholipase L1-like esterase
MTLARPLGAAALLALACWVVAGLWTWQAHRHAGRLEFQGYHLIDRGDTGHLNVLEDMTRRQTLHGGAVDLASFAALHFDAADTDAFTMDRLAARALVPLDTWVDLVVRRTDRGNLTFRVSRSPGMPSGWYVYDHLHCTQQVPVSTEPALSVGTPEESDWATLFRAQNMLHAEHNRAETARAFDSRWIELAVTMDEGRFAAFLNDVPVSELDLTDKIFSASEESTAHAATGEHLASGTYGIAGGDLPPARVDWLTLGGERSDGTPFTMRLEFEPRPLTLQRLWIAASLPATWLIACSAAMTIALVLLLPTVSPTRIMCWESALLAITALATWWVEHRVLIESPRPLPGWWTAEAVLMVFGCGLLVLRHRRSSRLRWSASADAPGGWHAYLWLGLVAISAALLGWIGPSLMWQSPRAAEHEVRTRELVEPWDTETPLHIPLVKHGDALVSLESRWKVTLQNENAALEVYTEAWNEPITNLPRWTAVRFTPQGSGFVPSRGVEPPLDAPGLAVGVPHELRIAQRGERLTLVARALSASPEQRDDIRLTREISTRNAGGAGVVARAGSGEIALLEAKIGLIWRRDVEDRSLTQIGAARPGWMIGLVAAFALTLSIVFGALTSLHDLRASRVSLLWSLVVAVAATGGGLGLLWLAFPPSGDFARWSGAAALWGAALIAVTLWWLFWSCNFEVLRGAQLVSLAMILAAIVCTEMLARSSPERDIWRPRAWPGPVLREFVFSDASAGLVWNEHTREVTYNGVPCPIEPEHNERRVFALGGSSTWGAGVEDQWENFTNVAEGRLRGYTGDKSWRVYNGGWPSFTVLDDLLRWRRDVRARRPEALVIHVSGNDHVRSELGRSQRAFYETMQALNEPTAMNRLKRHLLDVRVAIGAGTMWQRLRGPSPRRDAGAMMPVEEFEETLATLVDEAEADGVKVVLIPEIIVEAMTQDHHPLEPYHEAMDRIAESRDAVVVNSVRLFRKWRFDNLMEDHIHPNEAGNQLLAALMTGGVIKATTSGRPEPKETQAP